MKFIPLPLAGAYAIEREEHVDARGFFSRTYCRKGFAEAGLDFDVIQVSLSGNVKKGTLRGLHFQVPPYGEAKLVSCVRGAIFDCIVDFRPDSPTYLRHLTMELEEFGAMLYIPAGFAHGYQTLHDDCIVQYHIGTAYVPEAGSGLRWNDPALAIAWPECEGRTISEKDRNWALLESGK